MTEQQDTPKREGGTAATRLAIDLGPLLVFFAVNAWYGIFPATAAFMVAIFAALAASRILLGRISPMPLITAVLVTVFGGLTLFLQDETFIKIKPTVLYVLFAVVLYGGLAVNRLFLQMVMGEAIDLTREGWRILTIRWAAFFLVLAGLNEAVWRNTSTDFWVSFKVFGLLPLTFVFAALQIGLLKKHNKTGK